MKARHDKELGAMRAAIQQIAFPGFEWDGGQGWRAEIALISR